MGDPVEMSHGVTERSRYPTDREEKTMTPRPEVYRRMDDQVDEGGDPISPAHRELARRLSAIEDGIRERNLHARLEEHLAQDHAEIRTSLDALADEVLGPCVGPDFDGNYHRDVSLSIRGALRSEFRNGGSRLSLSKSQNAAVWAAAIGGASLIVGHVIDLLGNIL
jgi:hypothetical protein